MNKPILTIITRHMVNKRKDSIRRMIESISHFDKDKVQHLIIRDEKEAGHVHVSKQVINSRSLVDGLYVWFLDDDDVCTCPQLPIMLERIISQIPDVDLIMTRSLIYKLGIFPTSQWWGKDIGDYPIKTVSIMTPIVRREIFTRAIVNIEGHTHQVDTQYFRGIQSIHAKTPLKVYHLNYIIGWQPFKLSTRGEKHLAVNPIDKYIQFGI